MFRAQHTGEFKSPIRSRARLLVIVHLCLVFWYLVWVGIQPFIGDYWERQTTKTLYRVAFGDTNLIKDDGSAEAAKDIGLLTRNRARFHALPESTQEEMKEEYERIRTLKQPGLWQGIAEALELYAWGIPPFVQAWVLFSVAICFLVLYQIEGATAAAWLLPVIVGVYAYQNQTQAPPPTPSPDQALFPSEQLLEEKYLGGPIEGSMDEQREQILLGWRRYLVDEWTDQEPAEDPEALVSQAEEGDYRFVLKRLELRAAERPEPLSYKLNQRRPLPLVILYCMWNLLFAAYLSRPDAVFRKEEL